MTNTTRTPGSRLRYVRRRPAEGPTRAAVERERSMWGPHPDPAVGRVEGAFYAGGFQFLTTLYGAAMGVNPPRKMAKAFGPRGVSESVPPGDWGIIARSFKKDLNPLELRNDWANLIDRLVSRIFPHETQEDLANAVAVQAHWLGRVRAKTDELATNPPPATYDYAAASMSRVQRESMEWTFERGARQA